MYYTVKTEYWGVRLSVFDDRDIMGTARISWGGTMDFKQEDRRCNCVDLRNMSERVRDHLQNLDGYDLHVKEKMLSRLIRNPTYDEGIEEFHYNIIFCLEWDIPSKFWDLVVKLKEKGRSDAISHLLNVRNMLVGEAPKEEALRGHAIPSWVKELIANG